MPYVRTACVCVVGSTIANTGPYQDRMKEYGTGCGNGAGLLHISPDIPACVSNNPGERSEHG